MRFLLLSLIWLAWTGGFAQSLFLYHVKGGVELIDGKMKRSAETGNPITTGEVLRLGADGVAGIVDKEGRAILLRTPGTYTSAVISDELNSAKKVSARYFSYVWKKFNDHHHRSADETAMRATGGISRSDPAPMRSPVDSANVISSVITFSWDNADNNRFFTVFDARGNEIMKASLSDSTVTLYPAYSGLERGESYYWTISRDPYEYTSEKFLFYVADDEWIRSFRLEEEGLRAMVGKEEAEKRILDFRAIWRVH